MYPQNESVMRQLGLLGYLFVSLLFLSACTTPAYVAMDTVSLGQEKSDILELLGSPQQTYRARGQDIWTYTFFNGHQEISKQITFENSRVVNIKKISPLSPIEQELQKATTLEEYEEKVRAMRGKANLPSSSSESGDEAPPPPDLDKEP